MEKLFAICITLFLAGISLGSASAQTTGAGRAIVVATPTPGPVGIASTALNSSLEGGVIHGQGTMGGGVNAAPVTTNVPPIVPGPVIINSNATSVGTGNVAGSVQINNGGPGSVTGAPTPVSPVPTYVTPGTGLGTAAGTGSTVTNPNPGSVQ